MSFYDAFEQYGQQLAFVDDRGLCVTYMQVADYAATLGAVLQKRSLAFVLCENTVGSAMGYLAILENRVVPLLLDRKIDRELLAHLLEIYQPNYLYYPQDLEEEFGGCYAEQHREYGYILGANIDAPQPELFDELGLLLTTSGSTGSPKLVRQSYRNIQSNAEAIAEYLGLDKTERPVNNLPMNYTYGLSIINSHVQVGATILLTDCTMMMKRFWDFMKGEKATSFAGVPFTYELLKKARFFRMDLPDLRYITQAGGKLSPEMHHEFAEWSLENGKKFIVMYGQTEASPRMGYLPAEKSLEKAGSMGIPIPGGKFTLIDVNGDEINTPETVGEMVYSGENVTLGYAERREDLSKGDERNGVLPTGDMAKFDEDGYYYIVGRKKRFLKIFGNRVNIDEIDRLIKIKYEGMDCASTGVDDKMKTFITDEAMVDSVRQYLSETTHLSESAFDVRYLAEIPKNESGKTLYTKLPD